MEEPPIIEGNYRDVTDRPKREPFFGPWKAILAFTLFIGGQFLLSLLYHHQ